MDIDDELFAINETSSEGIKKKENMFPKNKKLAIGGIIFFLIIFFSVIIFILFKLINLPKSDKSQKKILGEITCKYNIDKSEEFVFILGKDFESLSEFDISIDGKIIKYSKEFYFGKIGIYTIQYLFYQKKINMNYMFKDISHLVSVNMTSDNNIIIESMRSTFENCINLNYLNIKQNKF